MKEMLKLGFVLAVFALVACTALAFVNGATAPVIAEAKTTEAAAAMKLVYADAVSFDPVSVPDLPPSSARIQSMNAAKDEFGTVIGVVVQAAGPTYDKAVLMVGVNVRGELTGTVILELSDTPGFGQKAKEPGYMDQYTDKTWEDAFEVNEDIAAISGATISSKGIAEIVKNAALAAKAYLAGGTE